MKLAHLILVHNHPQQLERLVTRLNHKDADIYIHLDTKTNIDQYKAISKLPNTFFIKNRTNVMWGEYSVIQATLNGMEEILATKILYSHINLLSGNDYPLQSANEIQNFLFNKVDKTFMWYDQIFDDWIHGQVRINTYYLGEYGFPGRYHLSKVMNKILPHRKLPNNLKAYGRAQWLTITPALASYVINFLKTNPIVERFFKMTWCVDEVFFQTILCNSPYIDSIVNDNLRYVVLTPEFSPVVFTLAHANELSTSGKFYARKFDSSKDSAIFDYLDTK